MTTKEIIKGLYNKDRMAIAKAIHILSKPDNKGEWIPLYPNDPDLISFECKSCGEEQPFEWNFCPNCGADMRGDKPNE